MPHADDEQRRRAERARRVALFRYELIQDVIDPALSSRQRGRLIRALAECDHQGPFGVKVRVSRPTIDPARVNLSEAEFLGNHCVVAASSFGSLIHTAVGSAGGSGSLRTKRSGCSA